MDDRDQPILMQYQSPLPDDHDVAALGARMEAIGPKFDRMRGLIFKLYGLNDLRAGGTPLPVGNEYSSIYLWESAAPMRALLTGDLFENYAAAFARPPVRWHLVHHLRGEPKALADARHAVRRTFPLPRRAHVGQTLGEWRDRLTQPEALVQVTAFDPFTWEYLDLTVWDRPVPLADAAHAYTVVRVSVPALATNVE